MRLVIGYLNAYSGVNGQPIFQCIIKILKFMNFRLISVLSTDFVSSLTYL